MKICIDFPNVIESENEAKAGSLFWHNLRLQPNFREGTLITAMFYDHLIMFWTDENICTLSPYKLINCGETQNFYEPEKKSDKKDFNEWCKKKYLDEKKGIAKVLYILKSKSGENTFVDELFTIKNIISVRLDDLDI
ncbi:MAG: hypothetical protein DRR08_24555 [Candidatus Parabeggiatoa sp. nov. 2]|nr:MAG: hypothetical protein DRR08_24555 [Gammaproteobacteria bacterium]